jgi:tripeptide aminopeptidase
VADLAQQGFEEKEELYMVNQERLVNQFLELVRIDSLTKKERNMADYLLKTLKDMGYEPYEDDTGAKIGGNAGNVICHVPA